LSSAKLPCASLQRLQFATQSLKLMAVEMSTYTRSEIESYSCVADDVACNAAPAVPSPADAWSGTINNA